MNETEQATQEDDETGNPPASSVEAYETEWYEVLKRRAEEGDEAEEDEDDA